MAWDSLIDELECIESLQISNLTNILKYRRSMTFDTYLADIPIFLDFRFKSTINKFNIQRTALKISVSLEILR